MKFLEQIIARLTLIMIDLIDLLQEIYTHLIIEITMCITITLFFFISFLQASIKCNLRCIEYMRRNL